MSPLRLLFLTLLSCYATSYAQVPTVSSGTIKHYSDFASKNVAPRNVEVWLPEGYDAGTRYPVLYMHDAQMLFDSTITWNHQEWGVDETITRLVNNHEIPPCIVVGVSNGGSLRHAEYFPQKPFESIPAEMRDSLYLATRAGGEPVFKAVVQSDSYLRFLVEDLKPFIDETYSTLPDRKHTYVMGSSMGGLISMYAICEYPQVFGGAGCLSTHWPGIFRVENNPIPAAFADYLRENLPTPKTHKLYFDYGTETLDAMYEPFQLLVDEVMKAKGYTSGSWITRKFEGADHSEKAWRARLDIPLVFLMKKDQKKKVRK